MSLSNYPPGVSGNEPHLRGWDDESDESVECGKGGYVKVFSADAEREVRRIQALLAEIADGSKPVSLAATLVGSLDYMLKYRIEGVEVEDCPFMGDVTVSWSGKTGYWTCPLCGWEHEVEADEPDEDWFRDR